MGDHGFYGTGDLSNATGVDFGRTAEDYGRHRAGFPAALFDRLQAAGEFEAGARVLDLGTGTGSLGRGFARRGCDVVGLDRADTLLGEARRLDAEAGVSVEYVVGRAEATGLPAASFDLVSAGQCWHWFDRPRAAREAQRLLRAKGGLLIAHFDWLPLPGNVVEATERLVEAHNPAWTLGGSTGLHPGALTDAAVAGFRSIESFSFDVAVPYSHEGWRGRIRASSGVGAALSEEAIAAFDRAHAELLAERFPSDPLSIPHRVFAMHAVAP